MHNCTAERKARRG